MSGVSARPALQVSTWTAPANIALIKYWGSRDPGAGLPLNPSISMTLTECTATCTVRPRQGGSIRIFRHRRSSANPLTDAPPPLRDPVAAHVRGIVERAGGAGGADVAVGVDFPVAAGLASSSAIFAAVTHAATQAFGLDLDTDRLSDLARASGSGSAARSVVGGFVEWRPGSAQGATELELLAPASHWAISDVIAIADPAPKKVSSREGHRRAFTSPYFERRLALLDGRLSRVRDAIRQRDFPQLGEMLEEEAMDLHLIAMSSRPPIRYWRPATVAVLEAVEALRRDGVPAFSTLDAGPNVHVLCEQDAEDVVARRLAGVAGVQRVIRDRVGEGPAGSVEHLL